LAMGLRGVIRVILTRMAGVTMKGDGLLASGMVIDN